MTSVSEDNGTNPTQSVDTGSKAYRDSCTAFVSNLDYSITQEQLHEIFSKVIIKIQFKNNCVYCIGTRFSELACSLL
jgi:RNA recognition motif-containing protein